MCESQSVTYLVSLRTCLQLAIYLDSDGVAVVLAVGGYQSIGVRLLGFQRIRKIRMHFYFLTFQNVDSNGLSLNTVERLAYTGKDEDEEVADQHRWKLIDPYPQRAMGLSMLTVGNTIYAFGGKIKVRIQP